MNIAKNKIVALLALKGLKSADYARFLDILPQSLNSKYKTSKYTFLDLLKLGDLTGTRLAFVDKKNKPVVIFELDDIRNDLEPNDDNGNE